MIKKVRYNGGKETYKFCSDPELLVTGRKYYVIEERDYDFQTNFVLKGIDGEFNSVWFDDVVDDKETFIAVAFEHPKVGENYHIYRVEVINRKVKLVSCYTSKVVSIKFRGSNIYNIETVNSHYIVNVSEKS